MKFSLLTDDNRTENKSYTDSTQVYLKNVDKTIGINVDQEKQHYENSKSFRSQYPVNEFTSGEYSLVAAFPNIFMFGKAYKKNVSNLNQKDCIHLLSQFSSAAATCSMLVFYLFDIQRRHKNIRNIAAKRNTNKEAFEEFSKEITSTEFEIKLQNAVANPASKDASQPLGDLHLRPRHQRLRKNPNLYLHAANHLISSSGSDTDPPPAIIAARTTITSDAGV